MNERISPHNREYDIMALANIANESTKKQRCADDEKRQIEVLNANKAANEANRAAIKGLRESEIKLRQNNNRLKFVFGAAATAIAFGLLTHPYTLKEGVATVGEDGDVAEAVCSVAEEQIESLPLMSDTAFNTEECEKDLSGISTQPGTQVSIETTVTPLSGIGDGQHVGIGVLSVKTGADGLTGK